MAVSTGGGEDEVMSTINITPFTDVLLVLLIIFIILASVTKEPKLPDAYNKDKVTAVADRRDRIDDKNNISDRLESGHYLTTPRPRSRSFKIKPITSSRASSSRPIRKASYGVILQVMDAAKSVDLTDFGLANHVQGTPEGQSQ